MNVENNLMSVSELYGGSPTGHNIYKKMAYYKIPSVSIAVIYKGKIDWARAYGFADIKSMKPANENTLYQSASLSKCITALCAMTLVQEGKLSLYTALRGIQTASKDSIGNISLLNLLSHTSGFENQTFVCYSPDAQLPSVEEMVNGSGPSKNIKIQPLLNPGQEFYYSYDGFVIAARLIELAGNAMYDSLVRKNLFLPLSMNNSTFNRPITKEGNYATGYYESIDVPDRNTIFPPPLGLWTNPVDVAKLILGIQHCLKGTSEISISDTLAHKMLRPVVKGPYDADAACGFFIDKFNASAYFSDEGEDVAYKTLVVGGITSDNGLVVMINKGGQSEFANDILRSVIYTYKWEGLYPPTPKKKD